MVFERGEILRLNLAVKMEMAEFISSGSEWIWLLGIDNREN